jgi:hypothetical protein
VNKGGTVSITDINLVKFYNAQTLTLLTAPAAGPVPGLALDLAVPSDAPDATIPPPTRDPWYVAPVGRTWLED